MINNRQKSILSFVFILLLAGFFLFLAFRGIDWIAMLDTVRQGRFDYLLLGCFTLTLSHFIRSLRWRLLLSAEQWIAPITVFWATMVGYLGNSLLPARAGELMRTVLIGQNANMSKIYVLATVLTERILDVVALVLIGLVAFLSLDRIPDGLRRAVQVMGGIGLIGVGGLFIIPHLESELKRLLVRFPWPISLQSRLIGFMEQFLLGMRAFQHTGRAFSFALLTLIIWLMDALVTIEVAQAFNLSLTLSRALLLLAALGLSSAIPSTPGYLGIYQFVAVAVLVPFGFLQNEALVFIIAFQAISYIVVLTWGLWGLVRLNVKGLTWTELR